MRSKKTEGENPCKIFTTPSSLASLEPPPLTRGGESSYAADSKSLPLTREALIFHSSFAQP